MKFRSLALAAAVAAAPLGANAGGLVNEDQSAYVLAVNAAVCGDVGVASAYFDEAGDVVAVCNEAAAGSSVGGAPLLLLAVAAAAAAAYAASATD